MEVVQTISTGYEPRPHQARLHRMLKRFNVLVCHRRFGKTVFSLNELIDQALRNELKNPQYAYIAPFYSQAKRVAWDYLKEYTKAIPGVTVNESELKVEISRPDRGDKIKLLLLGADNPGAIRGIYLDGVIMDEYAEMDPTVWTQVIRPALSDRLGWGIFIGTPKGQNHFHDIYQLARKDPSWFTAIYRASETKIIAEGELDAARKEMSEEEFEQEYECSFSAALIGAYYGKQMEAAEKAGRITSVPHDPAVPVDTFWDLGIGDTTAIWFLQQVGRELHLIDYVEMSGVGLDWYTNTLKKKSQTDGYVYRELYLPHDAGARELGTGKTRVETLRKYWGQGVSMRVLPRQKVEDGINAVRLVLPMCWFDEKRCERGISALKNYQRAWDPKNKIFQDKPKHDWSSHGADAFRQLGLGIRKESERTHTSQFPRTADNIYDIFGRR